jgi:hypothetical protein
MHKYITFFYLTERLPHCLRFGYTEPKFATAVAVFQPPSLAKHKAFQPHNLVNGQSEESAKGLARMTRRNRYHGAGNSFKLLGGEHRRTCP